MGNAAAPLVPIDLDRRRHLRLDFNALAAYEEATGKSVLEGQVEIRSARGVRDLLWAALLHEDPELTREQVGAMLTPANAQEAVARLNEAMRVAAPEERGNGLKAVRAQTG